MSECRKRKPAKVRNADEALVHLDRCARRAWGAAFQASESLAAWKVLNNDSQLRAGITSSPVTAAADLIQNVLVEHQIIAVIRLFDPYRYDRLSFFAARESLKIPGVQEALEERSRQWPGSTERKAPVVRRCINDFNKRLDKLATEDPNRQDRLRNHRDQNTAHELHFLEKKAPAFYSDIEELLLEAIALTKDLGLAVLGMNWHWDTREVEESVRALWQSAAAAISAKSASDTPYLPYSRPPVDRL